MTGISPAATLAWKIAAFEALHAQASEVEPEHLLIGICSLEKGLLSGNAGAEPRAREIEEEKSAIDTAISAAGLDTRTLRREIRHVLLPAENPSRTGHTLHRSPAAIACFERAEKLANGCDVTCTHLCIALIENPASVLVNVFDRIDSMQGRAGNNGSPFLPRVLKSMQDSLAAQDATLRLVPGIEYSQKSLASLSPHSDDYRKIRKELIARTLLLARTCLDCGDGARLTFALRGLEQGAADCRGQIHDTIAQVEFLNAEGISIGAGSKKRIRDLLGEVEMQVLGGRS